MFKTEAGETLSKGDVLWAGGFKLIRAVGPKIIRISSSPYMGLQPLVREAPYEKVRNFWFLRVPPDIVKPTLTFLSENTWLLIPEEHEIEAGALASALWGPIDEDVVLYETPRKYKPRTHYGFSYDIAEVIYRALTAYLHDYSYREQLEQARSFCFDKRTWPEALGLYLRGDKPMRDYISHHLNDEVKNWLRKLPMESRELFSLDEIP